MLGKKIWRMGSCILLMGMLAGCGEKSAIEETTQTTTEPAQTDTAQEAFSDTQKEDESVQEAEKENQDASEDNGNSKAESKVDQLYGLFHDMSVYDAMDKYCINIVDGGKYAEYEGDIGAVIPEYKDIDLDGDGKYDVIRREGKHYVIEFSSGESITTDDYSASPNEGEIIEFADLGSRNVDEILITHYTDGTAGPGAWDTSIYSNAAGQWKCYSIIGKDGIINSKELQQKVSEKTGSPYDGYSVNVAGVEMGNEIYLLIDYGAKSGAMQIVDYEMATLWMDFRPDHITGYDEFELLDLSNEHMSEIWLQEEYGTKTEITPSLQEELGTFLTVNSESDAGVDTNNTFTVVTDVMSYGDESYRYYEVKFVKYHPNMDADVSDLGAELYSMDYSKAQELEKSGTLSTDTIGQAVIEVVDDGSGTTGYNLLAYHTRKP